MIGPEHASSAPFQAFGVVTAYAPDGTRVLEMRLAGSGSVGFTLRGSFSVTEAFFNFSEAPPLVLP